MELGRIFGPKMEQGINGWRRMHNEELNDCTPHQILFG
jgi:hypothetical protein